jgi:hypothetical protein
MYQSRKKMLTIIKTRKHNNTIYKTNEKPHFLKSSFVIKVNKIEKREL